MDRRAGTVRLTQGTGHVDRIVSLSPEVAQALQVWRAHHPPGPSRFPSPTRHRAPLVRSHRNGLMPQSRAAAGLTRHDSPPCVRPTCATHRRNAGVACEVLQALLGHTPSSGPCGTPHATLRPKNTRMRRPWRRGRRGRPAGGGPYGTGGQQPLRCVSAQAALCAPPSRA